jgi:hypothetical protein
MHAHDPGRKAKREQRIDLVISVLAYSVESIVVLAMIGIFCNLLA